MPDKVAMAIDPPEVCLGVIPESEERILDAEAIEKAAESIKRPTALLQVKNLVEKIRRDAKALQRAERSKAKAEAGTVSLLPESAVALKPESAMQVAAAKDLSIRSDEDVNSAGATAAVVVSAPTNALKYTPIDRFAFDSGKYDSPTVTLYVTLPGVGALPKENVTCEFTKSSFDLVVDFNVDGSTSPKHRLFRDNLFKDVRPDKCKFIIKKDKVVIKLAKVKGEYSYDNWTELTAKKKKSERKSGKESPTDSIMDLMKDMYDSGDDNMKKMIGETMLKQRNGELDKPGMDDMDMDMDKYKM